MNEFVVYFKSLSNHDRYTMALVYADGSEIQRAYGLEVLKKLNLGWSRVPNWVPADAADSDSQTMITCETPIGEWNAIIGIAPARWFRALV